MKKLLALTISATFAAAGAQTLTGTGLNGIELGLTGGYANGLSGEAFVHAPNVAGPFGVRASVSFTRAADSINDNAPADPTGTFFPTTTTFGQLKSQGNASESGSHTVAGLDGTYSFGELSPGLDATAYAGARYGMFRATSDIGGRTTTYSSNVFGVGGGIMVGYALTGNLSLIGDIGVDQFFGGAISTGQDTFRPGEGGYNDVSNTFVRPGTVFKARVGIKTTF